MRRARKLRGDTARGPARGARHRDAGAPRRARPLVPARGRDGLPRLRTHGRGSRARPPPHGRAAARRSARALPRHVRPARHVDTALLGLPTLALGVVLAAGGSRARRPARSAARATGPTRGRSRSGAPRSRASTAAIAMIVTGSAQRVRAQPVDLPARVADAARRCRRSAILLRAAPGGAHPAATGRGAAGRAPRSRRAPAPADRSEPHA